MQNNLKEVRERIYFNKSTLKDIEFDILNRRHIERYALIRQYLYGDVLDVSCGSGYGSYLVSNNPDINSVLGLDISKEGIDWAKDNFETEKVKFLQKRIEDHTSKADVLVSIETIEHLENPHILNDLAERCQVDQIIVSYPSKKTTHYNSFHFSDFIDDEIIRIFSNFKVVDVIDLHRECRILKLQRYDSSL
tara:strand:+ start:545 stop:1120 length:576 start_codon:yes stop_codon:yes gene_type:complete